MIQNLSIGTRLIALVAFLAIQLIIGAAIGIVELGKASDEMQSMYNDRLVPLGQLDQVIRLLNRNEFALARAVTGSTEDIAQFLTEIDENTKKIDKQWTAYMATYLTSEEKHLATGFTEHYKKYSDEGLSLAVSVLRANDIQAAKLVLYGPLTRLFLPVRESINALIQLQLDVSAQQYKDVESRYKLVRNVCIAGMLLGIALAALIGWWIVQGIVRPLQAAVKLANRVATGDLTQEIKVRSRDETGQLLHSLKQMNDNLVQIVGTVREGTDAIASASAQVASGNIDLSSRTEQQASSLEETASSMEELTSTVRQTAENARQANELAVSSRNVAVKGGEAVFQVIDTMGAINAASRRIADIISTIDSIAFQTNILALNAAVEAARAGEHGRGFAVVASEVRTLAQRSAVAAKEIKTLIDDSVNKIDAGSMLVNEAGGTMREIVAQVQRVTDVMAEMLVATQEQAAGIGQVSQAVGQMDQVTQQNASLVEEAAAAADSLRSQADGLAQTVAVFKVPEDQLRRNIMTTPRNTVNAISLHSAKSGAPAKPLTTRLPPHLSSTATADSDEF